VAFVQEKSFPLKNIARSFSPAPISICRFATVIPRLRLLFGSTHRPERRALRRHRYALHALNPSRWAYCDILNPDSTPRQSGIIQCYPSAYSAATCPSAIDVGEASARSVRRGLLKYRYAEAPTCRRGADWIYRELPSYRIPPKRRAVNWMVCPFRVLF
jgi:hypothetical protein